MNIKTAVAEGFNVLVVKDMGWPFTSEKAMCECRWCQGACGVFGKLTLYNGEIPKVISMVVHEECFDEASEYVSNHQPQPQ